MRDKNLSCYDNRELSWLKFNQRVLEEAEDNSVPLFERLKFVSIFNSNLDEFFMIRVGTLFDQTLLNDEKRDSKTNLTPQEQLSFISEKVRELLPRKDKAYHEIMKSLADNGAVQLDLNNLSVNDRVYLEAYFKREILPLLSPTVIDKKHPVPFLKNKYIFIGVVLKARNEKSGKVIGLLPATNEAFSRLVYLPSDDGVRFVLAEDIIEYFADLVFTNYDVLYKNTFRITRNADIDVKEALYDHDVDFRDVMEELLKKRKKLAPVRIEFSGENLENEHLEAIAEKLELPLGHDFIFSQTSPLDTGFIFELEDKLTALPKLFFNELEPQNSAYINHNEPMIKQIERKDILLSYPYESIRPFIRLLEEAAEDKTVVSIKITLYRVARDSKIVNALIKAAENGKEVLALVELRARFDEENNIGWSKRLSDAGVRVIYGLDDLKVHSKLLLITKKTGSGIRYITQIGTGNYNERTSKLYTDLSIMTSNMDIGTDASIVFNALSVGETVESTNKLWVAPLCLKSRVVEMIDNEITYGSEGYIGLKLNSLTDKDIIQKLVEASCSGVKIQLVIRGICCLVAGVPNKTENITISSIVGRFLEHSRVYIFGKDERQKVYISSADFMTRNTQKRVEVAAPILDEDIKNRILSAFHTILGDNVKARHQHSDGSYSKTELSSDTFMLDSQLYFYRQAYKRCENANASGNTKGGFISRIIALFKRK